MNQIKNKNSEIESVLSSSWQNQRVVKISATDVEKNFAIARVQLENDGLRI